MKASAGAAGGGYFSRGGCLARGFFSARAARLRWLAAALVAAGALFMAGCGEIPKAKIGESAPEISARDTAGKLVKLPREGLVLVEFWENGCAACLKIMDDLEAFAAANGLRVLAINSTDGAELIASHESEKGYSAIRFLRDNSQISAERYEIFAIPTIFIVQDGTLREKILGERTMNFIAERVKAYL